ncbi:related to salicylate 1-monooxygenase [Cephalotrichum gorgonifer]|uniref:Related to salicylate 1-monooxygenase n=1 Tax=Cephalotrichum gorgonifer TaxID=2041049 RepID=A0AAE8SU74_9PEZI|nr:related to salicylate 1-monooxygenase [Cephalotrichum gorgonifer]
MPTASEVHQGQDGVRITIIGGGIAGLATAIALRSPTRTITVLERSEMLKETGALISLQPNASKIVSSWGLAPFLGLCEPLVDTAFRMFNQSGKLVRQVNLDFARFGADRVLYHRQDLHTALKNAATSTDLPGCPVEIRTASRVTSCDPYKGTVTINGGETLDADIVIGADGIHSVVRQAVVGEPREAIPTGISAYRMLLPVESLSGLKIPKDVLDIAKPVTTMVVGHDRRVIMGPGRGGKVFGIVALVPDENMHETSAAGSWVAQGSIPALLKAFAGFPAWMLEIFERAPDVGLWQLRDIDPLPRWVRGRTILIGDAAHAMLPTQGQGASQSFEDAEALQAFLADLPDGPTGQQVNEALLRVYEARHERASLIQMYSREQARPGTDVGSNKVKLDPAQFMKYNCNYSGAKNWLAAKDMGIVVEKLSLSGV